MVNSTVKGRKECSLRSSESNYLTAYIIFVPVFLRIFSIVLALLLKGIVSVAQVTDARSGVIIEFDVHERTFPESWKNDEINAKGTPLADTEKRRSIQIVKKSLEKYPVDVLKNNLKKVVVLNSMEFYNVNFGGTNSTDVVYISNSGVEEGYSDYYIEKTFHQEFSSILLRNYPEYFNKDRWQGYNRVHYRKGGVGSIETNTCSQDFDSLFHKNGFLYEYATSDLENDFNSFAENLFIPVPEFWKAVEKYSDLYNKTEIIVSFYNRINEKFTKQYFKSFDDY